MQFLGTTGLHAHVQLYSRLPNAVAVSSPHVHVHGITCIYSVWCLVSLVVSLPRLSPSYSVDSKPVHQVYYEMSDMGPAS